MDMTYWANKPTGAIGKEIMAKVESYREYMINSGMLGELRKSFKTFYGPTYIDDIDQSLKTMHVNHYASLIRNIHTMVTAQRPAWEPMGINTDLETQGDTQLAAGLLDYYMREKQLETKFIDSVLKALFLREGWISMDWSATSGEVYGTTEEGLPIYEGDIEYNTHTILDITRDVLRRDMNHEWYIVRKFKNKYDLAAKYPELAEKIIALKGDNRFDIQYELTGSTNARVASMETELIPTYTLYHAKTDAVPQGRMVEICDADIELFAGPLPYKRPYVFPITAGKYFENAFGHSYLMDLLPLQDAIDMTISAILTNQDANAVQNFQVPKGASPNVTKFEGGLNVWEYDPEAGKMERMDLLGTAPEVFNFAQMLISQSELLSNVSQISRGNAPPTMSGTAMALLQQQAIQSTSAVNMSYTLATEHVGTGSVELLQDFAVVPRVAMITGKSKQPMMRKFKGDDLKGITRVFVNSANPLTKTSAGRVEIANQLLAAPNMIKTPEQYLGVLTTGNLEPLYQHDNSQRMLMIAENEKLMEGVPVQALLTDDHPTHVLEHSCVLSSPEARENPQVVQAALTHIQEHINIAKNMDPATAAMLKQASFFQPPPPPMPTGAPGPEIPQVMDNQNPVTEQAEQTKLPNPAQPPNPGAFEGQQ